MAKRILVVDDDDAIRELVTMALEDEGYEATAACDGAQALSMLGEVAVDLILLDMRMPVMDGWQFARAYRARPAPHAPVVVVTAGQSAAQAAADIGAIAHLAKPFELVRLLATVAAALDGRRAAG